MSGGSQILRPEDEPLQQDRRVEARVLWKGVLALLGTVALALVRQRWWVR